MSEVNQTLSSTQKGGRARQSFWSNVFELLGSMRFAISLLTLICIASSIGTVVRQNEPWVNYVNQFGPFWAGFFDSLGLFKIYNAPWFIGVMAFLVVSTSLCVWRNTPKMIKEMRVFREGMRENSLKAFAHRWEGLFVEPAKELPLTIVDWLRFKGFKAKVSVRENGTMIGAKAGSGNRFGYIATHLAIIVICIGGLLDSGVPLKVAIWALGKKPVQGVVPDQIPAESRLSVSNPSYRANLLLPEGQTSRVAVINTEQGLLVQDLPFELTLKQFRIDFYSTGMPKLFASDVQVFDRENNKRFDATIEVNKPLVYKGVTIFQSSFDDGGTHVSLKGIPLTGPDRRFDVSGDVGTEKGLSENGVDYRLELTGFRAINVESMPVRNQSGDVEAQKEPVMEHLSTFQGNLASVVGPGVKHNVRTRFTNVGPRITYKLRDTSGQAKEFQNYMVPIFLDGSQYFLAGVRDTPANGFQYLRIPADERGLLDGFMRLREALNDKDLRKQAAQRFAEKAFGDKDQAGQTRLAVLREQVSQSALRALDQFAGADGKLAGLPGIAQLIEKTVPEASRQSATDVMIKIIQGSMWELYELSRLKAGLSEVTLNEGNSRFVQDAQVALSDLPLYGSPFLLEMEQFKEIKASVFQVAKAPGQWVVYAGCLLLVIGVFSMFYIRERRVFFWITPEGDGSKVLMGISTTRQTMDFEKEYQQFVTELNSRSISVGDKGHARERL